MATFIIPTATDGSKFYDQLTEIDGREYLLRFQWNDRDAGWYMDICDQDEVVIVAGIRVVADMPLLRNEHDTRLPKGVLLAVDESGAGLDPGLTEFGDRVKLIYDDGEAEA